jgi:integrase
VTYFPFDGFERPEKPVRGRSHWLRKEEVTKLIDSATSDDLRFILYCGFHAGLRRGEIGWAKVDWFDLKTNLIHVVNDPETGALLKDENRTAPVTKPFAEFLTRYFKGRNPDEYVLAPKREKGKARYRYDFIKQFQSHVNGACTIHDMRRSFASNLASAGVSIYKIAQWLGDRVEVVERSYGYLAPADDDVNKLW